LRPLYDELWIFYTCLFEKTSYNYLDINLNKYLNFTDNIDTSCRKLRSTLPSLVNVGLHPDGLDPLTVFKIYKSVVIPKPLYSCEIWLPQSRTKQLQLEQAHIFWIKYIERVPTFTKTDVCMSLLGSRNIEFEIDFKKLNFLGQLCRLHTNHISYIYRPAGSIFCKRKCKTGFHPWNISIIKEILFIILLNKLSWNWQFSIETRMEICYSSFGHFIRWIGVV